MTTELLHADVQPRAERSERSDRRWVRIWLYFCVAWLLLLVAVGGATRLTDSGLSITEWKPIHGVIPPLSAAEWQEEFDLYKQIPEYQLQNAGMSMAQFQVIYWWEWGHRFLARFLGLVFFVPFVFLLATGRIDPRIRWPLFGLFLLGGLQGFIGWWMVSSGLTERVDVSHYRLAVHLTMAGLILAMMVGIARSIAPHAADLKPTRYSGAAAFGLVVATLLQIWMGAMVAGLDAGLLFNEWPLMGEGLFPAFMWDPAMGWRNWLENPAVIQFSHRTAGYVLWGLFLLHMIGCLRWAAGSTHARRAVLLFALVNLQIVIGIATLLSGVYVGWALAHQLTGFATLALAVAHWRAIVGPLPLRDGTAHRHA